MGVCVVMTLVGDSVILKDGKLFFQCAAKVHSYRCTPISTVATLWLFDGGNGHYSGHSVRMHQVLLCAPIQELLPG